MKVVNYTGLKKREKNIYTLFGFDIPGGGVSVKFLFTFLACEFLVNFIVIMVCLKTGHSYISLATGDTGAALFGVLLGGLLGFGIDKLKIKGHDCYIYIFYVITFMVSPKYKDVDGDCCDKLRINNKLFVEDEEL